MQLDPVLLERLSSSGEEDRMLISIDDVPQKLIDTLVYVEDRDFYNHHGISIKGILRALWVNFKAGKKAAAGFIVGQVMKLSKGKAVPKAVGQMVARKLSEA